MIVYYFHIPSIGIVPTKTDSPPVIYSDAVFSFSIAGELFETVSRRDSQINDSRSRIQHFQFSQGNPLKGRKNS